MTFLPSGNATDSCACPDGFSRCGGRCYHYPRLRLTYNDTETHCASLGAHIATPRSEQDNVCISSLCMTDAWFGFRGAMTLESFVGMDGCGGITFSNWQTYEPSLDELDNCISGSIKWYDDPCAMQWDTLCQLPNCYRPECP